FAGLRHGDDRSRSGRPMGAVLGCAAGRAPGRSAGHLAAHRLSLLQMDAREELRNALYLRPDAEERAGAWAILLLVIAARRGDVKVGVILAAESGAGDLLCREGDAALLPALRVVADQAAAVPAGAPDVTFGID